MDHIQYCAPLSAGAHGVSPLSGGGTIHGCIDTLSLCMASSPGGQAAYCVVGLQHGRTLGKGGCGHPATERRQDGSGCMEQWSGKASSARLITNQKALTALPKSFWSLTQSHHISHITLPSRAKRLPLCTLPLASASDKVIVWSHNLSPNIAYISRCVCQG